MCAHVMTLVYSCMHYAPPLTPTTLQAPKQAVHDSLEKRLRAKCCRVAQWQAPAREAVPEPALQLARVNQLPRLLSQQREEAERCEEEGAAVKRECRELVTKRHKVGVLRMMSIARYECQHNFCSLYQEVLPNTSISQDYTSAHVCPSITLFN